MLSRHGIPLLKDKELTKQHRIKLKKILEERRKELQKALNDVEKGLKVLGKP